MTRELGCRCSVVRYIADVLDNAAAYDAKMAAAVSEVENAGYRIVNGGQVGSYDDDDRCSWRCDDWRTGEVLASSIGTREEFDREADSLSAQGRPWYHIDNVGSEIPIDFPPPPEGLPGSLADALGEWAENNRDEARRFIGADPAEHCSNAAAADV